MIDVTVLRQELYLLVNPLFDLFPSIFQYALFDSMRLVSMKSKNSGLLAFAHYVSLLSVSVYQLYCPLKSQIRVHLFQEAFYDSLPIFILNELLPPHLKNHLSIMYLYIIISTYINRLFLEKF